MNGILPYLNFDGTCHEAMRFYQRCLGGELEVMTFADWKLDAPPGAEDRVVHACLTRAPVVLMASDTMPGAAYAPGTSVWVHLLCGSDEEVDRLFAALAEDGSETLPPHDSFWGARFAMLTDRFGIGWMLNHERSAAGAGAA